MLATLWIQSGLTPQARVGSVDDCVALTAYLAPFESPLRSTIRLASSPNATRRLALKLDTVEPPPHEAASAAAARAAAASAPRPASLHFTVIQGSRIREG